MNPRKHPPFPFSAKVNSGVSDVAPHLQWRDRIGFSPNFPFKSDPEIKHRNMAINQL
ncbi:hypothetical protein BLGI_4803 [Brevibacillus laterosporus GI-9]|nr:hypothetical protein BLGI_4803 [Brevibacillus laterosporus GI-9]